MMSTSERRDSTVTSEQLIEAMENMKRWTEENRTLALIIPSLTAVADARSYYERALKIAQEISADKLSGLADMDYLKDWTSASDLLIEASGPSTDLPSDDASKQIDDVISQVNTTIAVMREQGKQIDRLRDQTRAKLAELRDSL